MPKEMPSATEVLPWVECLGHLTSQIRDLGKVELSPVLTPNVKEKIGRKMAAVLLDLLEAASTLTGKLKKDLGVPERPDHTDNS